MRDIIKLKGDTVEEKLAFAETVINRLARRSRQTATLVMPPYPISHIGPVEQDGTIFTFVSSVKGTVVRIVAEVQIERFKSATIEVQILRKGISQGILLPMNEEGANAEVQVDIEVGDRVVFSLSGLKTTAIVATIPVVLLGFAIVPRLTDVKAKEIAIGALEEAAGEIIPD